jgi:hypothetical protein
LWAVDSNYTLRDCALFMNYRYNLNTTGGQAKVARNYWGVRSSVDAQAMVKGTVDVSPVMLSDPTPDQPPRMISEVPSVLVSEEDAASMSVHDLGPHFSDDTWYYQAYLPQPSQVRFEVVENSDPWNVTLRISERSTCDGSCPINEGELKASTASNWYGEVRATVRAYDWRGKHVDTNTFTIRFLPHNDRPVISVDDIPKNSKVDFDLDKGEEIWLTIYDDGPSETVEVSIDGGDWVVIQDGISCAPDNSTRSRDLPACAKGVYFVDDLESEGAGEHTMVFRACDGEHCSDEVYTGRYQIEVEIKGGGDDSLSSQGMSLAVILIVFLMLTAFFAAPGKKRSKGKKG